MIALRDWILGLFTRHLGTKILSLVLAAVLFGFVQKNLSADRPIRTVVLNFRVATELEGTYAVLQPRVQLRGLRITGLRSRVDTVAQRFTLNNEVALVLDREFLRASAGFEEGKSLALRIDREFFRSHPAVLGEGVDLSSEVEVPPTVVVDVSEERVFEVVADPATAEERAQVDKDAPVAPPGGAKSAQIRFEPAQVLLRGPRSFLPPAKAGGPSPLFVVIPDLRRRGDLKEGENSLPVERIDWMQSGVNAEGLGRIAVVESNAPGGAERLLVRALFSLEARDAVEELADLPFVLRGFEELVGGHDGDERPLWQRFTITSGLPFWESGDLEKGRCRRVRVEIPRTLLGRKAELRSSLVVVVDFGLRKQRDRDFDVPLYLDVRNPRDPAARQMLAQVRLDGDAEINFVFRPPE